VARIRDDLEGSVHLHVGGPDGPVVLFAGEKVPEGSEVGAHLLALEDLQDDFTVEGGAVDESGDTGASDDSEPEVGPKPADDGTGELEQPKPAPAKRTRGQAKA
jgi:hypothetical protein